MTPVGAVLIIGFVVILILAVMADKKGYKKWNLNDIGYISSYVSTYKKQFSICDRNMQAMKGEFLKKHAGHIQYAAGGKAVE